MGDGAGFVPLGPVGPPGTPFNPTHTYVDNGTFTVTVRVTDDDNGVGETTTTVTVNNVAPAAEVGGDTINEGETATIGIFPFDPGILDSSELTVDWGDGTINVLPITAGTTSISPTHVYLDDDPTGTPLQEDAAVAFATILFASDDITLFHATSRIGSISILVIPGFAVPLHRNLTTLPSEKMSITCVPVF